MYTVNSLKVFRITHPSKYTSTGFSLTIRARVSSMQYTSGIGSTVVLSNDNGHTSFGIGHIILLRFQIMSSSWLPVL